MDPKASVLPTTPQRPTYNHLCIRNKVQQANVGKITNTEINYTELHAQRLKCSYTASTKGNFVATTF